MIIPQNNLLVEVKNLKKEFRVEGNLFSRKNNLIYAVNNISFNIRKGETLGLVGESGSGKTTTGKLLIRLIDKSSGEIYFEGKEITKMPEKEFQKIRKEAQIIFQDPYSSLNPRKTVFKIISDPLITQRKGNSRSVTKRVIEMLKIVGLPPESINKYPHEFSGGQRQRIGIARALVLNPKFIVCDEPVSALDVSIQAQILNLLEDLQKDFNITYLFIAHNLSVVRHISNRIAVMYLGKIVEISDSDTIINNPIHPYTKFLIFSIPTLDIQKAREKQRMILEGDITSPINLPSGCFFHPRCPYGKDICRQQEPDLKNYSNDREHFSACHFSKNFL